MNTCDQNVTYYLPLFSTNLGTTIPTIAILAVFLPIKVILIVLYYFLYVKKNKNAISPKRKKNDKYYARYETEIERSEMDLHNRQPKYHDNEQSDDEQEQNRNCCEKAFPSKCSASNQAVVKGSILCFCFVGFFVFSVVSLIYYILSTLQTFQGDLASSECFLANSTSQFINGNDEWIGLDYYSQNITFLDLALKTRIKPSENSIKSLLLNGTGANFPIGFPNQTDIFIVNSETNLTLNKQITTTNVESYIESAARQWLFRNSSLSNIGGQFPICQDTTIATLPHPLPKFNELGQTAQLDYMDSICKNLTIEVDQIVANGKSTDNLLIHLQDIEKNITVISANLSEINESINVYGVRASEYEDEFTSLGVDYSLQLGLGVGVFGLGFLILLIIGIYIFYLMVKVCQQSQLRKRVRQYEILSLFRVNPSQKQNQMRVSSREERSIKSRNTKIYDIDVAYRANKVDRQPSKGQDRQKQDARDRQLFQRQLQDIIGISSVDSDSDDEDRDVLIANRLNKIEHYQPVLLPQKSSTLKIIVICFFFNTLIGLFQIMNSFQISKIDEVCKYFEASLTSSSSFLNNRDEFFVLNDPSIITNNILELLAPIQQCTEVLINGNTSASNSHLQRPHFSLQSNPKTLEQLQVVQELYKVSSIYNSSIPVNIFDSQSITQITILQDYLIRMETLPIKTQQSFNLVEVLAQLNQYTNGSSANSPQVQECGSIVLEDQYVYSADECNYPLIDYDTQITVTEPRCLQIPTYDGSSGTANTDLNNAQHTIVLNSSCTSMQQFYNSSKSDCFLAKRIELLKDAGCVSVAEQYSSRVGALIDFSIIAGSLTNSYLQNLRNFFGVYAVVNTNLTDFFANKNTSGIIHPIGVAADQVLNKTLCEWVSNEAIEIYNQYCLSSGEDLSFSLFYYNIYVWLWIVWFAISVLIGIVACLEVQARKIAVREPAWPKPNKQFQKKMKKNNLTPKHKNESANFYGYKPKQSSKKLQQRQQSEQTMRNGERDIIRPEPVQSINRYFKRNQNIFTENSQEPQSPSQRVQIDLRYKDENGVVKQTSNRKDNNYSPQTKNMEPIMYLQQQNMQNQQKSEFKTLDIDQNVNDEAEARQAHEGSPSKSIKIINNKVRSESINQNKAIDKIDLISVDHHNQSKIHKNNFFHTRTEALKDKTPQKDRLKLPQFEDIGYEPSKMSKMEKEDRRLKVVELGQILDRKIDSINFDDKKK